ncbi:hypothetical protein A2U01_0102547, partial [Trifolium medium]|nr:hypothetical protein [Trifolium medium]
METDTIIIIFLLILPVDDAWFLVLE